MGPDGATTMSEGPMREPLYLRGDSASLRSGAKRNAATGIGMRAARGGSVWIQKRPVERREAECIRQIHRTQKSGGRELPRTQVPLVLGWCVTIQKSLRWKEGTLYSTSGGANPPACRKMLRLDGKNHWLTSCWIPPTRSATVTKGSSLSNRRRGGKRA